MGVIKTTYIEGDVSVGRDMTTGGNLKIRGDSVFDKNVKVKGWLEARNIRGAGKGLFLTAERLNEVYPRPLCGWWALVGKELPAELYVEEHGVWVGTGTTTGEPTVEFDRLVTVEETVRELVTMMSLGMIDPTSVAFEHGTDTVKLKFTLKYADDTPDKEVSLDIGAATQQTAGVMTAEDKTKLDSTVSGLQEHVDDMVRHVTQSDKDTWNGHVENNQIHVLPGEADKWNGHVENADIHVTAEQKEQWDAVGSITLAEADTLKDPRKGMRMYRVTVPYGKSVLAAGFMMVTGDSMGHGVTQVLFSNFMAVDGKIGSGHKDGSMAVYYRYCHFSGGSSSGVYGYDDLAGEAPKDGEWTKWYLLLNNDLGRDLEERFNGVWDKVNGHVGNTTVHVTAGDKDTWNGHVENEDLHVTADDKLRWNLGVNVVRFGSITYFTGKVLQLGYGGEYKAEEVFFDSQHNMFLLAPGSGGNITSLTRAYLEWNDRRLFTAEFGENAAPGAGRLYLCEADMRLYRLKAEGLEPVSTVNLTAKDIERIAKEIDIKSVSDEEIDGICR